MAVLLTPPFLQFFDSNGDPLNGGKIYTYTATGTFATPKATYTTEAGDVEHPNPIILNSAGIPATGNGSVWLSGTYDIVVKDSSDVEIETTLNVTAFTTTASASTAYFESFSGNGSNTSFTTSTDLGTDEKTIFVWVDAGGGKGYDLQAPTAYTINGTTLTFSSAPASGTNNIYVSQPSSQVGAASSAAAAAEASAAAALASETNAATSETNAATSETNAATSATASSNSATSAATSATQAAAAVETAANTWTFDSTTTMAEPATGFVRFNNATYSVVTQLAFDAISSDTGSPDLSAFIATWGDNNNANGRGTLVFKKATAPEDFVIFKITGAVTDNTSWLQVPVSYVTGSGSFTNNDEIFLAYSRSGTDGTNVGTVTSVGSGDGLTGGPITSSGTLSVDVNGSTSAVVTAADEFLFGDVSDSNAIKKDTIEGIFDLSGGGVLLNTQTASASSSLDHTSGIDSTYSRYKIQLSGIILSTTANLLLLGSINGGSSYLSSNYRYHISNISDGSTSYSASAGTGQSNIFIGNGLNSLSETQYDATILIEDPSRADAFVRILIMYSLRNSFGSLTCGYGAGVIASAGVDAIRIAPSGGTITSGTSRLYGIK